MIEIGNSDMADILKSTINTTNNHKTTNDMPRDVSGMKRLRELESLIINSARGVSGSDITNPFDHGSELSTLTGNGKSISIEALLDSLIVLYDECCNSSVRREKTVSDFIEIGE